MLPYGVRAVSCRTFGVCCPFVRRPQVNVGARYPYAFVQQAQVRPVSVPTLRGSGVSMRPTRRNGEWLDRLQVLAKTGKFNDMLQ